MLFDTSGFMKEHFNARTEDVGVMELKKYFKKDDPVWQVRGLTGIEVFVANEAVEKNKSMSLVAEALAGTNSEKVDAFRELFGVASDGVPGELVKRKEMLVMGSVSPVCSEEMALKIADAFPAIFTVLTSKIIQLSNLGKEPGKRKPSGKKPTSETA